MKKLNQNIKFLLRLAYKNIIYTKFRSIILFITFIILFFLSIAAFSTKPFLNEYYYHYYFSKYKDIDLYLTYDENSSVRFFSIRKLIKNINIEEDFNFIASFFETASLIEVNDNLTYVKILASNIESLKNVNHKVPKDLTNINANEIIITTDISEKYNVNKNDFINMYIGSEIIKFKIIEVVENDGLMYGETVFIDKDSYISHFLNISGNTTLTKNIYNIVYLDLKDNNKIPLIKEEIKSISYYEDLNITIKETINIDLVEDSASNFGPLFYLAFIFIIFALILVLQSTLTLIFEERKTQVGIVKILGGNNSFAFTSILIEFFIYAIPAVIISYFLGNIIVNSGLKYIGSSLRYVIPIKNTIYATIFVLIGIIIITSYNYVKILTASHIKLSTTEKTKYKEKPLLYLIFFIISAILLILTKYFKLNIEVKALFNIILAFIIIFTISKLLLSSLKHFLKYHKQKNLFTLLSPNILSDNKIIKQVINVLLISFIIIIFLTGLRDYGIKRGDSIKENINIDIAITNIINNMDTTYKDIQEKENVSTIDKAILYKNVYLKEFDAVFWYHISVDADKINEYFNISISKETKNLLNDKHTPYILLPKKYQYIYNVNVGDKVTLAINNSYDKEEFYIAGFFDLGISEFIFTNLNVLDKYQEIKPNSLLINFKNYHQGFYHDFMKFYNKNMHQVINFHLIIEKMINLFHQIMQYLIYILIIMIICFMLTIFNNSILQFNYFKTLYSRLRVLGCSYNKLVRNIIYELIVILIIIFISIMIMLPIINKYFHYLLLFFNSYEYIYMTVKPIFIGFLLAIIMYLISYLYYFYQLKKLDYSNILKNY